MSAWETYFTAGYTVSGAAPVIVDRYCRSREKAERAAKDRAYRDVRALSGVGIEIPVDVWVEKWRTRRVEEHDDREVFHVAKSIRRDEPRDLTQEDAAVEVKAS